MSASPHAPGFHQARQEATLSVVQKEIPVPVLGGGGEPCSTALVEQEAVKWPAEPRGPGVAVARSGDKRHQGEKQQEGGTVDVGKAATWEERRKPTPAHRHPTPLDSGSSPFTPESGIFCCTKVKSLYQ